MHVTLLLKGPCQPVAAFAAGANSKVEASAIVVTMPTFLAFINTPLISFVNEKLSEPANAAVASFPPLIIYECSVR